LVAVVSPELVLVLVLVVEIPNKSRRRTSTRTRRMLDFRLSGFGQHALKMRPTPIALNSGLFKRPGPDYFPAPFLGLPG
jgi:hypothetical protein